MAECDADGARRDRRNETRRRGMDPETFLSVGLRAWILGTIGKVRAGEEWAKAWKATYKEIGGQSCESGKKVCPMVAARTLYEFGRIKDAGTPFLDWDIADLWRSSRNGTYAMLAVGLARNDPTLDSTKLWKLVQDAVRRETGDEPAASDQGAVTLAFKLWHLGLIVGGGG